MNKETSSSLLDVNKLPDIYYAEKEATQLLLDQRLFSLKFDVRNLKFKQRVLFDSMQNYCIKTRHTMRELSRVSDTHDGLTIKRTANGRDIFIVLYNDNIKNSRRRNFTLAHEVGHICLGHDDDGPVQEREANAFAAQLLLPRVLLRELVLKWDGSIHSDDVCAVFGASREATKLRMQDLCFNDSVHTKEDIALLKRFGNLLPEQDEPIISI